MTDPLDRDQQIAEQLVKTWAKSTQLYFTHPSGLPLFVLGELVEQVASALRQVRAEARADGPQELKPAIERLRVELSQHRDVNFKLGAIYALDAVRQLIVEKELARVDVE